MSKFSKVFALGTAITLALVTVPVAADYAESGWHYFKTIELPTDVDGEGLVEVPIDAQTFEGSPRGLADLRIVDAGNSGEAQYKLVIERAELRRSAVSLSMSDLGSVVGQRTQFVLTLSKPGSLHNEVEILTSSLNFQRRVMIEASADGSTWAMLEDDAEVYDFTIAERGVTTRDTHVRYPLSTAQQIRITIVNGKESALDIQGASGFFIDDIGAREINWPATVSGPTEDAERRTSHTGSNEGTKWTTLRSSANVYAFNTPQFRGSTLSLGFANSTFRFYRVSVLNEDNPPLQPLTGAVYGPAHNLVFQPQPGATYRLYYGNTDAHSPSYELEHLLPYFVTRNLPIAQLGTQSVNLAFSLPPVPFSERYPWLLPIALTIGGLLIGFFLTRLWADVKTKLPPPSA
jgi:hypothetical protein